MAAIDAVKLALASAGIQFVTPDADYATLRGDVYILRWLSSVDTPRSVTDFWHNESWELSTSLSGLTDSQPLYDAANRASRAIRALEGSQITPESISVSYDYSGIDETGQDNPASFANILFETQERQRYAG